MFNFNDDKSRRQIDKARNYRNDTKTQNAMNREEYNRKINRLLDGRGEWEVSESLR